MSAIFVRRLKSCIVSVCMPEDKSEYEKKIAKANAARNRQIERQKEKLASAEYQQKLQDKQQAAQARAYEKNQARMADPDYINEQWEKKLKAQKKQVEKQTEKQAEKYAYKQAESQTTQYQVKESTPEYSNEQYDKKIAQAKALQQRALKKSANKLTEKKKPQSTALKTTKPAPRKPAKSKGLAGRNATVIEKRLANKIGEIGCICCLNKNWYTSEMQEQESTKFISLHHIDGRTKPWAHAKVLPLCAYHHDVPAPSHAPAELTPIHRGNKKQWIAFNGTEEMLLKQVYEMIGEVPPWLLVEV